MDGGGWRGEGRTDEDKVGRGGGVAEECQGREVGGHGEGLLMSRETVLCWRSLRGWQSLLNTNPWELRSPGGEEEEEEDPVRLQLTDLDCCQRSGEQWGGRMIKGLCGTERRISWFNSDVFDWFFDHPSSHWLTLKSKYSTQINLQWLRYRLV